jgi:hypothetical protein
MNKERITQVTISILAIIAITYGRLVNFPDAVHRLYGFPLNWGTHQLVSIAGPVDIWSINLTNLTFDLAFWMLILLVIPTIVSKKR